jgi:formylglycine-generating enzyme required for sulfatase activity
LRSRLIRSSLLLLLIASSAAAVTMDWTPIGNPGNACEPQPDTGAGAGCFGAVGYEYSIGTYEVTNAQYAEFLNAKAFSDPFTLYNTQMGTSVYGGIMRNGSSGSYTYSVIAGRGDMPVNFVSFYDAVRFANWLNNGQGSASTETGAYTLLGGTPTPSNGPTMTRNPGATIVLPSEDEWYKAAYHDAIGLSATDYFDYPAVSNTQTTCSGPTAAANHANCGNVVGNLAVRGSYMGSASPYGTFDQGGNVAEWNECCVGSGRGLRGGAFDSSPTVLAASYRNFAVPGDETHTFGFRLALVPEPDTGLLVIAGLLGFAARRRGRDPQQVIC